MGERDSTKDTSLSSIVCKSLSDGAPYDVAIAGLLLTKGIPVPPSVIRRFRVGVGRLVDNGFDLLNRPLERANARADNNAALEQKVVNIVALAGATELADSALETSMRIAKSMLREHALKFDNRAAVAQHALEALRVDPPLLDTTPEAEIDADWLNYFSEIAGQKSGTEMQRLMGKILAGEIRQPGSFSPLTISALASLSIAAAQKFELLSRVAIKESDWVFVPIPSYPNFFSEGIPEIGFSYPDLLLLRTHRLLATEAGSSMTTSKGDVLEVSCCHRKFSATAEQTSSTHCVLFSPIGCELYNLLVLEPFPSLNAKIAAMYASPNWKMKAI